MLANPLSPETEAERRDVQNAAQEFGLRLSFTMFSARATSRPPLQPSSSVGQADCSSVPARF